MRNTLKAVAAAALLGATIGSFGAGQASAALPKIVSSNMPVKVLFNARVLSSDVQPKISNGAVLVPIRFIGEKLGVNFALSGKTLQINNIKTNILLTIGSQIAVVNGKSVELNETVQSESGRILVPLQVVNLLNVSVEWDSTLKFVWVGSKEVPEFKKIAPDASSLQPYLKYFKDSPSMLTDTGKQINKVTIINQEAFPFQFQGTTFYRLDLAKDNKGASYIRVSSTDTGIAVTNLYFVGPKETLRNRYSPTYLRYPENGYRLNYYPIVDRSDLDKNDRDYKEMSIKKVSYVGIHMGYETMVMLKNPWR
ncbi:copper amine oxidase N-terminal domain-containing protein [Paenibacillus aurantiacus]|uniref:Copper amine oxidase N-terminal domain-containing protein n=1 Tax=Paenibacillus aurantiacus TaxID=1936118 RepID=A0ABV5KYE3_9BACL